MVYELQSEGMTFYCNCSDVVSVLVETGWTVSDVLGEGRFCGGESTSGAAARVGSAHRSSSVSGLPIGRSAPTAAEGAV